MQRSLYLLGTALLLSGLAACRFNSTDLGPAQVQGTWAGTLTDSETQKQVPVIAAIFEGGPGFLYDSSDGLLYAISPLKDKRQIAAHMSMYRQRPEGELTFPIGISGLAYSDRMIFTAFDDGARACPGGCGTPATPISRFSVQLGGYQPYADFSPSGPYLFKAGRVDGFVLNSDIATSVDLTPGGAWSGTDVHGCAWTGGFEQNIANPRGEGTEDLFLVIAQGGFDPLTSKCDAVFTGVGFLSDTGIGPYANMPGVYFDMALLDWGPKVGADVLDSPSALMYQFKFQ